MPETKPHSLTLATRPLACVVILLLCLAWLLAGGARVARAEEVLVSEDGNWEYVLDDDGNATIFAYEGDDPTIYIPPTREQGTLDGHPVVAIEPGAFMNNKVIETVWIYYPVGLSAGAFGGCTALQEVHFMNDGITDIPNVCFTNCTSLTSIEIPGNVNLIGQGAFSGCTNLKSVSFLAGSEQKDLEIEYQAFASCTALTEITFPKTLDALDREAFLNCTGLQFVTFLDAPSMVDPTAFFGCGCITTVSVPSGFRFLDQLLVPEGVAYLFFGLDKSNFAYIADTYKKDVTQVCIPAKIDNYEVRAIGGYAFQDCTKLTSIVYPEECAITDIGEHAFYNCSSLTSITIPKDVTSIGMECFATCTALEQVKFEGNKVSDLRTGAFYHCTALKDFVVPNGVKNIYNACFDKCANLTSIKLPDTIELLGEGALGGCTALKDIYMPDSDRELTLFENAFEGTPASQLTFHVRWGSEAWYWLRGDHPRMTDSTVVYDPVPLNDETVKVEVINTGLYKYCMMAINPSLKVTRFGHELAPHLQYTFHSNGNNINAGDATVDIVGEGLFTDGSFSGSRTVHFTIERAQLSDATTMDPIGPYAWDNLEWRPDEECKFHHEFLPIRTYDFKRDEYTLSYSNNKDVGENTAIVTMTMKDGGNFIGSKSFTFSIAKRDLRADGTITGLNDFYPYTGDYVTPVPTVTVPDRYGKDGKPVELAEKWGDFTISYSNNVRWGTATLTIDTTGSKTLVEDKIDVPFVIRYPLADDITIADIPDQTYTGEVIIPEVTASAFGTVLPTFAYEVIALPGENVDVGMGRAVVRGLRSEWTVSKEFNIVPREVTVMADDASKVYGAPDPDLTATVDNDVPAQKVAYTLSREAGEDEGVYVIAATGDEDQGNYHVYFENGTFTINSITLDDMAEVAAIPDQTYCGKAIEPALTVTRRDTGATLVAGEDFELVYEDNEEVGTATVTLTGKGHCKGTTHATFKIVPRDLSSAGLTFAAPSVEWWGGEERIQKPTVTLDGVELKDAHDYQLSFANDRDPGTATVTVSGTGNYTGTTEGSYEITPFRVAVLPADATKVYGQPDAKLEASLDRTLWGSDTVDYTVAREPGEDAGTYAITVTAERRQGNYEVVADATATMTIERADLHEVGATISAPDADYDGTEHKPTPVVRYGDMVLEPDKDFEIAGYAYNQHAGTAFVIVHGIGNFKEMLQGTFTIHPIPADISVNDCAKRYGEEDPEFTVTEEGVVEGDHLIYEFSREPGEDVGTYAVEVSGRQYDYVVTYHPGTLTILPADLSGAAVSCEGQTYAGSPLKPEPTVTLGEKELTPGTDFVVKAYEENVDVGTATVTIEGKGSYEGTATGTFAIAPRDISVDACSVGVPVQEYTGSQITPEPSLVQVVVGDNTLTLTKGVDFEVTGYGENVVESGTVQIGGIGNFTGVNEGAFRIVNSHNLDLASVGEIPDQVFTGSTIEPDFVVSLADVDLLLRRDVDYTATFENNVDAGTAKVTIAGIAPITGSLSTTFRIVPASLADSTVVAQDQTYDGTALRPGLRVTLGDTVLVAGKDYAATGYENNVNVGTATVTITGKGNYEGMASGTFEIVRRKAVVTPDDLSKTFDTADPQLTATVEGLVGSDSVSYELSREPGEGAGTYAIAATGEKEQGNYAVAFAEGTFTIEPADLSGATVTCEDQTYAGRALEPVPTVTLGGEELVLGRDYTCSYDRNTDVGTAEVTVDGTGNYAGTAAGTFTIAPFDISGSGGEVATGIQLYTGEELEPTPRVTALMGDGRKLELKAERDFAVTGYTGNVSGPLATVRVEGKGNFAGTNSGTFSIVSDTDLTLGDIEPIEDQAYTGSPVEPHVKVSLRGVDLLIREGVDYSVSYRDNVDAGTATVTVTGLAPITGSLSTTFMIVPTDLSQAMVTADSQSYTGSALEPAPTVTLAGIILPASDYTVSFDNNVGVGTAGITVAAASDNCTGSASGTFEIVPRDISGSDCMVTVGVQEYTGGQLTPDPSAVQVVVGETMLTLEQGVDYEVTGYGENVTESGTVFIRGIGNFTGANKGHFAIVNSTDLTQGTIEDIPPQVFTGSAIEPSLTVRLDGVDLVLVRDVDYTATFVDNVNVGVATVTIEGIAPFTGTLSATFTIVPADLSAATVSCEDQTYSGSELTPMPTVTFGDVILVAGTDFEVTGYKDNVHPGTATVTVVGIGNYSGSSQSSFEIGRRSLPGNISVSRPEDVTYSGMRQTPAVTVADGDKVLTQGRDYELAFGDNLNAGIASVNVIGRGDYEGTVTVAFTILPRDVTVTATDAHKVYGAKDPTLTVTIEGVVDELAVKYDLARDPGEDVGQYAIHVSGDVEQGNYAVTFVDGTFTVRQASLAAAVVDAADQTYAGSVLEPEARVSLGDTILVQGVDYTVRYLNNVRSGTATMVVKGMGNYRATVSGHFVIAKAPLVATYAGEAIAWNGKPQLAVEVTGFVGGEDARTAVGFRAPIVSSPQVLEPGEDYELTPSDGSARDYDFAYVAGTLFVGLRPVSADPVAQEGLIYIGDEQVGVSAGQGFSVQGGRATDAGSYTAVATLDGGWSWSDESTEPRTLTWSIAPVAISAAAYDDIPDQTHTGSACEPAVVLHYADDVLVEGRDYEVSYVDNVQIGKARAVVTGKGNFEGSLEISFDIVNASYRLVMGPDDKVVRGESATFTFERVGDDAHTFAHFVGVEVDGRTLAADAYDAKSGSVVVTLKSGFTKTLSAGEHVLTARFDDGSADGVFEACDSRVEPVPVNPSGPDARDEARSKPAIPKTGDAAVSGAFVLVVGLFGTMILLAGLRVRR